LSNSLSVSPAPLTAGTPKTKPKNQSVERPEKRARADTTSDDAIFHLEEGAEAVLNKPILLVDLPADFIPQEYVHGILLSMTLQYPSSENSSTYPNNPTARCGIYDRIK